MKGLGDASPKDSKRMAKGVFTLTIGKRQFMRLGRDGEVDESDAAAVAETVSGKSFGRVPLSRVVDIIDRAAKRG